MIDLIIAIGSIGAALGAAIAAIASWKAVSETKKTLQAQLLINITDEYAKSEVLDAMRGLRAFEKQFQTKFVDEFIEKVRSGSDEGNRINHYRRKVSHHYLKIYRMSKLKFIDDTFVREVTPPEEAQFLFEVIEPLERIINPKYNISMFNMFRNFYPDLAKVCHIT